MRRSHTATRETADQVAARNRRAAEGRKRTRALGRPVPHPETAGREYSDDESEYLRACEEYRVRYQIRFMSATDYLHVLRSLGYAKPKS